MTHGINGKWLIENTPTSSFKVLNEAEEVVTPAGKKLSLMKVGGIFGEAVVPTGNKRRYSRPILEVGVSNLQTMISTKQCLGELDHPDDGRTRLQRVSHLITKLELRPDNTVYGEALILNTDAGRNLRALFEAGITVGCSSRGFGETEMAADGFEDVKPGYQLESYDFVYKPASPRAFPQVLPESLQGNQPMLFESMEHWIASQLAPEPSVATMPVAPVPATVSLPAPAATAPVAPVVAPVLAASSVSDNVVASLNAVAVPQETLESITKLLAPFVLPVSVLEAQAQGQSALEQLRQEFSLKESAWETERAELLSRLQLVENFGRETGFRLYLERELRNSDDLGLYNQMLGDLLQYSNLAALESRVKQISEEINKAREQERAKAQAIREMIESEKQQANLTIAQLQAQLMEARAQLTENARGYGGTPAQVQEAITSAQLQAYVERRVAASADPAAARQALAGQTVYTPDDVDMLLENAGVTVTNPQTIQERLRAVGGRGRTTSVLNEEQSNAPPVSTLQQRVGTRGDRGLTPADLADLGLNDIDNFNRLAGV